MAAEKVKEDALKIVGAFQVLPKLVVFDLDYTLWPFYCECRSKHAMPSVYRDVKGILIALKEKGVDMAIASRSPTPHIANAYLNKLDISSMFVAKEIFPSWSHKTEHFQKIHTKTEVPFSSMLFFDDEERNTKTISKMGVTSILVGNGVTLGAFEQGLSEFSKSWNTREKNKQIWQTKFSKNPTSSKKIKQQ